MTTEVREFECSTTRHGLAALWESGGRGELGIGKSQIVSNKGGGRKRPLKVNDWKKQPNGEHALLGVDRGDIIATATSMASTAEVNIYRIVRVQPRGGVPFAVAKCVFSSSVDGDEWETAPPDSLKAVGEAALQKARFLSCREPLYVDMEAYLKRVVR